MRPAARTTLWPWVKVLLCLAALDWALFGGGALFFRMVPELPRFPVTWGLLYRCVQRIALPLEAPRAYAVGSSIVFLGLDEARVRAGLAERDVPGTFSALTVFGTSGVDQALIAHAAKRTHPWLVVLTASVRDLPVGGQLGSPVQRVLLDSSVDLPAIHARDVESRLADVVRRWWLLYRYRFFAAMVTSEWWWDMVGRVIPTMAPPPPPPPGPAPVPSESGAPVPDEAEEWFFKGRITAESWRAWTHWRQTRKFADYEEFLKLNHSGAIAQYGANTFATHGPEHNLSVEALAWVEHDLRAAGARVVMLAFPENPVLADPEARTVYDPALADALAGRLAADAAANGARFVDLRRSLAAEDFYDLIHPNIAGARKLSTRLAEVIAEEWAAKAAAR
jgi:hypothetical protein